MTILRPYSSLARALVTTAIFSMASWSALAQIQVLDQVVAIVDDDIILGYLLDVPEHTREPRAHAAPKLSYPLQRSCKLVRSYPE